MNVIKVFSSLDCQITIRPQNRVVQGELAAKPFVNGVEEAVKQLGEQSLFKHNGPLYRALKLDSAGESVVWKSIKLGDKVSLGSLVSTSPIMQYSSREGYDHQFKIFTTRGVDVSFLCMDEQSKEIIIPKKFANSIVAQEFGYEKNHKELASYPIDIPQWTISEGE